MNDISDEDKQFEDSIQAAVKEALLQKYAAREPFEFVQYDGFSDMYGDDLIRPDEDGDGITWTETKELMSGVSNVRVLIRKFEDPKLAVRLLRKLANVIEQYGPIESRWRESTKG
jgi:hypothetical protein